jgi:hypothetical protein
MKKNEIVWGSPWEAAMAGVEAPWVAHGELAGEGMERGNGKRGRGSRREGCRGLGFCSCSLLHEFCCSWEETGRRKKRRKRKEKKKGKKEKKERNFFPDLEISEKIKDTLRSWSKIIFIEERYLLNYK